ncbi:MAG: radical protein [candidate division NC10 bacterium]|nr:radical protein [candidate division NC10 bacterium]
MNVLLLRPDPGNERFGLGPFFRVEPLGLEYIGAALRRRGHEPTIADLRFRPGVGTWLRRVRPHVVGISCLHSLEYDRVVETARRVRRAAPGVFVLVGGHAAAAFPEPLEGDDIDAVCLGDGERVVPAVMDALERRERLDRVPGLRLRTAEGWASTPASSDSGDLTCEPSPARDLVERHRSGYHCLLFRPVWLVETARGCPFRCRFCSVWQLHGHAFHERPVGDVVEDLASAGDAVFVADDLFWHHPARSREIAEGLRRRGVRKRWLLVQTRADLVARQAELLEAWRPLARDFDIFFGFEAANDAGLAQVDKDADAEANVEAVRVARAMGYGVNGNFLIDPDWKEEDFRALWEFIARHGLQRSGFTILTPLPGTAFFGEMAPRLVGQPWSRYDMHHVLWEPRLGARRFFELYAETWRRSVLNTSGEKRWLDWMRQVRPAQIPYLTRVLWRTQRMMRAEAYLREHESPAGTARGAARSAAAQS